MPTVKTKDLEVNYIDEGKGQVVLFIHGNYSSSYWWTSFVDVLKEDYRVIAPDLRGRGRTKGETGHETIELYENDLKEFVNALKLTEPVHLVGHSLGGAIITQYTIDNLHMVKSMLLIDTGWVAGDIPEIIYNKERLIAIANDPNGVREALETLIAPTYPKNEEWERLVAESLLQDKESTIRSGEVFQEWKIIDDLDKLDGKPVLLMRGELDKFFSPASSSQPYVDKITGAELIEIPGVGHSPTIEATDFILDRMIPFLQKNN